MILDEIFGRRKGTTLEAGLVDALDSDDFQCKLHSLVAKWHNLETFSSADMEGFLSG